MTSPSTRIVVLSDTHGHFSESLLAAIEQLTPDLIIHAGDSESAQELWQLELIAPLIAVRGNCDWQPELEQFPLTAKHHVDATLIVVAHRPDDLTKALRKLRREELAANKISHIVGIHGHTHVPKFEQIQQGDKRKVTVLCPGSPVEPRKDSQPSIVLLTLANTEADKLVQAEFIEV